MENLSSSAEKWMEARPFLREIGGLYAALYDILNKIILPAGKTPDFEAFGEEFRKGSPLLKIRDANLINPKETGDTLKALTALEAAEFLPEPFREGCRRLGKTLAAEGKAETAVKALIGDDGPALNSLAGEYPADLGLLNFFGWASVTKGLEPIKESMEAWQEKSLWDKAFCPTCGGEPLIAVLKKTSKGRRRYLSCGRCRSEWLYKRLGCPYCGNTEQKLLGLLECEEEPEVRADVCNSCGSYIKTYAGAGGNEIALEDWASLHLDILCAERDYKKRGSLLFVE